MIEYQIPRSYDHAVDLIERENWLIDQEEPRWRTMADVIADGFPPRERFPVVRTSADRVQLPKWLRIAVLKRDGFCCKFCEALNTQFEIDHIIPWSAGGPDASWNLRTLCKPCNQGRSNWNRRYDRWAMPIIPVCVECCAKARGLDPDDEHEAYSEFHAAYLDDESYRSTAWCERCDWFTSSTTYEIDRAPHQTMDWSKAVAA